jgi:ATPase family associated with various cellular activities (AAA)
VKIGLVFISTVDCKIMAISSKIWAEPINQLKELIQNRILETRDSSSVDDRQSRVHLFADFHTGFISDGIGIPLSKEEELICFIAMLPYLVPGYFDKVVSNIFPDGTDLPEMGGVKGNYHRGFMPTGETALFLLAGNDVSLRMQSMQYFKPEQLLTKHNILHVESPGEGEPPLSGKIILSAEILDKLLFDSVSRPKLSSEFPAGYISTPLDWNKLVINKTTMAEVETIRNWIAHYDSMVDAWRMKDMFKAGYKALFYGPPGTGKTFTATLLGKQFNKDVYRIDLSQIVSKYIGETEKNLERIFRKAENKDWILFFDEADALFGKRTSVSNAHDRYANQETSYLLQRIEDFNGLVILASNNKSNIDSAFLRRFNAIIHFPIPDSQERLHLWRIYLPANHGIAEDELLIIANNYEVTGSTILNSIHNSAINAFALQRLITRNDIIESLKRELRKEDRMLN